MEQAYQTTNSLEEMVVREERREVEVAETIERERQTTAAVKQLRQTIRDEKSEHRDAMKAQRKTHSQLKEDLQNAKQETFVQSRFREREVEGLNGRLKVLEDLSLFDLEKASKKKSPCDLSICIRMYFGRLLSGHAEA